MKYTRCAPLRSAITSALILSPIGLVRAKDEDNVAQVYLEFDPETGELKSATDAESQAMNHAQAQELQAMQDREAAASPAAADSPTMLVGVLGAVVLLAAAVLVWMRRRSRSSA